jgi:hypothetical protein
MGLHSRVKYYRYNQAAHGCQNMGYKNNLEIWTYLLYHAGSQQNCAKAIKLGSDEKVPTNWSTVIEPDPLCTSVIVSDAFKLVRPNT